VSIDWHSLTLIFFKTTVVYWSIIFGIKLLGRRALGQLGPQEFILIALLTKLMGDEIVPKELGLWGNLVAGTTLFCYVGLIDSIPFLRGWIQGPCIYLMKNGQIDLKTLKRNHLSEQDLDSVARKYGFSNHHAFDSIILERHGRMTGIVRQPLQFTVDVD
jgi:uncharacterized membrane protein YcaP (DUF421 family)